jgi:tetratricopeptide (TPR) repeat protein
MTEAIEKSSELYHAGVEALERADYPAAVELFLASLQRWPHFKTMERLGVCYQKLDRPVDAVLYLSAAAGLGNRQFRARYLLAEALLALGETEDAALKLKEAIELNSDYRVARELLDRIEPANQDRDSE